jgi:hypothetical protein
MEGALRANPLLTGSKLAPSYFVAARTALSFAPFFVREAKPHNTIVSPVLLDLTAA